jgi:hypothetical protein
MSMKNSSDTIGNQSLDLPVCSAVPRPTAPPRSPAIVRNLIEKYKFNGMMLRQILKWPTRSPAADTKKIWKLEEFKLPAATWYSPHFVIRYSLSFCAVGKLVLLGLIRQPDGESDHRKFKVPEYVVFLIQIHPPPRPCPHPRPRPPLRC